MFEPFHFISSDKRFGLCLPGELMNQVLARCFAAGSCETGGILVGKYCKNQRVAEVTAISDSPEALLRVLRSLFVALEGFTVGCKPSGEAVHTTIWANGIFIQGSTLNQVRWIWVQ